MADEPDVPTIFRTLYEARARQITDLLDAEIPPRFSHLRSFDYTVPGKLVFTGLEASGGKALVFELTTRTDAAYVERELTKAVAVYDRGA